MILLTGGTGQLGLALRAVASARGIDLLSPRHHELDVLDPDVPMLRRARPQVVIHCAAQTDPRACHDDPASAFAVNAAGALHVARACGDMGALLILMSTDAVFDGRMRSEPYTEDDVPHSPVNVYGASKLAAEHVVTGTCPLLVARIGWLFTADPETDRKLIGNLVRRSRAGERVQAVTDKWGSPSFAPHVAGKILDYATHGVEGIRHVANAGVTTRYAFTRRLLAALGYPEVQRATSDQFPDPVARPDYSGLTSRYPDAALPQWEAAVEELVRTVKTRSLG